MPDEVPLAEQITFMQGMVGSLEIQIDTDKNSGYYTPRIRSNLPIAKAVLATLLKLKQERADG